MKNSKKTFIRLLAVMLVAAFAFAAFTACKKKPAEQEGTESKLIGEWKSKVDIAPMIISSIPTEDLAIDLNGVELEKTEFTVTITYDKAGNYKSVAKEEEIQAVIDGLIDNNWDALQKALTDYAAEETGKSAEELTEEEIFAVIGYGRSWDSLKSTLVVMLPNFIDAETVAKDFTCEGKYTEEDGKLTMENFYKYTEFSYKLSGTTLTLVPTEATDEKPAEHPFPLVLEKTKE